MNKLLTLLLKLVISSAFLGIGIILFIRGYDKDLITLIVGFIFIIMYDLLLNSVIGGSFE